MKFYSMKNDRGFTLVEVLVAVVILSVGLLAVAGMQLNSMRGSNNALYRSQAVLEAEGILDSMRANRADAIAGDYNITLAQNPGAVVTHAGLVLTDLQGWRNALTANLPFGNGSIATNGNVVTVTVQWRDSFGQDTVVLETQL